MKPFAYQQHQGYFAQVAENLESEAVAELAGLGATRLNPVRRGLYFTAEPDALYRIVYQTRLCSRVLAPLIHFDCHSPNYLYKTAQQLPWEQLLGPDESFMINARVSASRISHSQYAALKLKDAIADWFNERHGRRPSVDKQQPDLVFDLYVHDNQAVISLDLAGGSLHRRGYRRETVVAPMPETLAAALVDFSGWDGERRLVDPFCGSGTLLAEALIRQARIPAGWLRQRFGFERLPDFAPELWQAVKTEAAAAIRSLPAGLIAGSDHDPAASRAARRNLALLPQGEQVELRVSPFQQLGPLNEAVIVANPPYGIRLGDRAAAAALVRELGSFLKHQCAGSTACLYFGDRQLIKEIGLKPSAKKLVSSGGLDGVMARYQLY